MNLIELVKALSGCPKHLRGKLYAERSPMILMSTIIALEECLDKDGRWIGTDGTVLSAESLNEIGMYQ